MVKKINFTSVIITGCFSAMILISCESHEQKPEDAFDRVKEKKMESADSSFFSKEIIQEPAKTEHVKKSTTPNVEAAQGNTNDWMKFKMETEKKILANEKKIKVIKTIPNANTKLLRKVTGLEQDNNDLRKQMDEYNETMKVQWENFKVKMNHDVNEINIELKDMTINNK